jgi:DNA-binding PadR family transcriptional regulator
MADLPPTTATGRRYLARFAAETVHVWLGATKPGSGVSAPALERLLHDGLVVVGDPEPGKGRPISLTDLGRAVLAATT